MRLIKKQTTNLRSVNGRGVTYDTNRIISADTNTAFYLPVGTTDERPVQPKSGYMRYNTSLDAVETFHDGEWRSARYADPVDIVQQHFQNSYESGRYYGPLESRANNYVRETPDDFDNSIDPLRPQSIIVLIGNSFQIGGNDENINEVDADFRIVAFTDADNMPNFMYADEGIIDVNYISDDTIDEIGWYIELIKPNLSGLPVTVIHNFNK